MPGRSKSTVRKAHGQLHVIVTCSDRKTRPVKTERCIRSLNTDSLNARITEWRHALQSTRTDGPVPAGALYSGDQWSVAKSIPRVGELGSPNVKLWICSAGYGLLTPESPVQPYSATFTTGHLDCVVSTDAFDSGDWWRRLSRWTPRGHVGPRSLQALAKQLAATKNSFMLVAVSEPYLKAIASDLRDAMDVRGMRKRIAVISVGGGSLATSPGGQYTAAMTEAIVPADARLKRAVGGAMQSLNVRLARHAVRSSAQWFPDRNELVRGFAALSKVTPALDVFRRERLTDDAIKAEIGRIRRMSADATTSSALRMFRDSGLACEQSRFGKLFKEHANARVRSARLRRLVGKRS